MLLPAEGAPESCEEVATFARLLCCLLLEHLPSPLLASKHLALRQDMGSGHGKNHLIFQELEIQVAQVTSPPPLYIIFVYL